MEIQTRLKAAGLDPGPLDGLPGTQIAAAIKQYEASKGRPQNGKPDRDLLRQLRRDAAPQYPR
jgi:membrane-bound lytic murein transglycosylase B